MPASKLQKDRITKQFEPLVEALKKNLTPIPVPQEMNHCIDVFSKWRGNYFYIMQKFKTGKNSYTDYFDLGLARLTFISNDRFDLAYFRHTGKWEPLFMYESIGAEEAKNAILNDHMFQVF